MTVIVWERKVLKELTSMLMTEKEGGRWEMYVGAGPVGSTVCPLGLCWASVIWGVR